MFKDELDTRWRKDLGLQELLHSYTYVTKKGKIVTAPKGFLTDGASIPKFAWSIVGSPWTGKYVGAAVIHDYLCREGDDRKEADLIFFEAMDELGVAGWKRRLFYRAVRLYSLGKG